MRGRSTQHLDSECVLLSRAKNSTLFLFCPNQFREDYVAQTSKTPTHQNSEVFVRSPSMSKWGKRSQERGGRGPLRRSLSLTKKLFCHFFIAGRASERTTCNKKSEAVSTPFLPSMRINAWFDRELWIKRTLSRLKMVSFHRVKPWSRMKKQR